MQAHTAGGGKGVVVDQNAVSSGGFSSDPF